jgi:hypothetical protein
VAITARISNRAEVARNKIRDAVVRATTVYVEALLFKPKCYLIDPHVMKTRLYGARERRPNAHKKHSEAKIPDLKSEHLETLILPRCRHDDV